MKISRRDFLKKALVVTGGAVAAACGIQVLAEKPVEKFRVVRKPDVAVCRNMSPEDFSLALTLIEEHQLRHSHIILHPQRYADIKRWQQECGGE